MKDVTNYEGRYAISDCGRVWSYNRKYTNAYGVTMDLPPIFMKPQWIMQQNKKPVDPYFQVQLYWRSRGLKPKFFRIHWLVASAFVDNPKPDEYHEVDHKNHMKGDNRAKNLQWINHLKNMRRAVKAGRLPHIYTLYKHVTNRDYRQRSFSKMANARADLPRRNGLIPIHKRRRHDVLVKWIGECDKLGRRRHWKLGLPV